MVDLIKKGVITGRRKNMHTGSMFSLWLKAPADVTAS